MAIFPVHYRPRPYQAEMHTLFRSKRVSICVLPRQTGKDVGASMEQCEARLRTPKTTGVYIAPDSPMIRNILWDKTYLDNEVYVRMLKDNVPEELVTWRDTVMEGRFSNMSRLKLEGFFQNGRDKNGVGTAFQDYTFTELALFDRENPIPRLMPIIMNPRENKRLMVVSTPRGKRENPLWKLMQSIEGKDYGGILIRTIDDLNAMMVAEGLQPVLSQFELEEARDYYLKQFGNDRMFEQEYYCSFEEMDAAAVYGEAYMQMERDHRIHDFNLNPAHPVYVVFDIGSSGAQSDATSWIAFQWINAQLFLFDCGEGHGKALPDYVDDLRLKPWFAKLATIILPWDAEHHETAINTTPADMVKTKFHSVSVLARSSAVWKVRGQGGIDEITDIQKTRMALYNTVVHKTNCDHLLDCMENYKYEFNSKMQEWSPRPRHDKYSHMMDALRYAVQATQDLDFFSGSFHDTSRTSAIDYVEDWSEVWRSGVRQY